MRTTSAGGDGTAHGRLAVGRLVTAQPSSSSASHGRPDALVVLDGQDSRPTAVIHGVARVAPGDELDHAVEKSRRAVTSVDCGMTGPPARLRAAPGFGRDHLARRQVPRVEELLEVDVDPARGHVAQVRGGGAEAPDVPDAVDELGDPLGLAAPPVRLVREAGGDERGGEVAGIRAVDGPAVARRTAAAAGGEQLVRGRTATTPTRPPSGSRAPIDTA